MNPYPCPVCGLGLCLIISVEQAEGLNRGIIPVPEVGCEHFCPECQLVFIYDGSAMQLSTRKISEETRAAMRQAREIREAARKRFAAECN